MPKLREMMRASRPGESAATVHSGQLMVSWADFCFTCGEPECRAWTIERGMNAQKAAGAIHSDIERGFASLPLEAANWE